IDGGNLGAGAITSIARGIGGNGGGGCSCGVGGSGGSGEGGNNIFSLADGASIDASTFLAIASGIGGVGGGIGGGTTASGNRGSAQGGWNNVNIDGDAIFGGSSADFNGFVVTAFAQGGSGGTGGSANAGYSSIVVNGSLTVDGLVQATAQAGGGNGDYGGTAEGGSAS